MDKSLSTNPRLKNTLRLIRFVTCLYVGSICQFTVCQERKAYPTQISMYYHVLETKKKFNPTLIGELESLFYHEKRQKNNTFVGDKNIQMVGEKWGVETK